MGNGMVDVILNLTLLFCLMRDRCLQYFKNIEHSLLHLSHMFVMRTLIIQLLQTYETYSFNVLNSFKWQIFRDIFWYFLV